MSSRNLTMWSLRTLAIALVAALPLAAAPAHAQDAHGAIAFGHSDKVQEAVYGFAWNHSDRAEAEAAALNACSATGGADCAVLSWFRNGCGALAMDRYGRAQGNSARSRERAEARAMRGCEAGGGSGCAIVESLCTEHGKQADAWSGSDSVLAAQDEPATARQERPAEGGGVLRDTALSRGQKAGVQRGLAALGFNAGPADGMFGPRTRSAIREWQEAKGLEATGYLTQDQADALAGAGGQAGGLPGKPSEKLAKPALTAAQLKPKCAELKGKVANDEYPDCWKELDGKPGCYAWHHLTDWKLSWSGACPGGVAGGRGTLTAKKDDGEISSTQDGTLASGKKQGRWVQRWGEGNISEAPYVDGKLHGRAIYRYKDGKEAEYAWVEGRAHGIGVVRHVNGKVEEFPYVHGELRGLYVKRDEDGDILQYGRYLNGKQEGRWITRFVNIHKSRRCNDGTKGAPCLSSATYVRTETPYVKGKKNGREREYSREKDYFELVESRCVNVWRDGRFAAGPRPCPRSETKLPIDRNYSRPRQSDFTKADLLGDEDRKLVAGMERALAAQKRTMPPPPAATAPVRRPRSIGGRKS